MKGARARSDATPQQRKILIDRQTRRSWRMGVALSVSRRTDYAPDPRVGNSNCAKSQKHGCREGVVSAVLGGPKNRPPSLDRRDEGKK